MKSAKVDNKDIESKLRLRRYFLQKYGVRSVLDCCCGERRIWGKLREEFSFSCLGIDKANPRADLKMDSARFLQSGPCQADVVDIDTYGSPWKHWFALLPRLTGPTTVFLTVGQVSPFGGTQLSKEALQSLNLNFRNVEIPPALQAKLAKKVTSYCLTRSCDSGILIVEGKKIVPSMTVTYIGLRLRRQCDGEENRDLVDRSHVQPLVGVSESL